MMSFEWWHYIEGNERWFKLYFNCYIYENRKYIISRIWQKAEGLSWGHLLNVMNVVGGIKMFFIQIHWQAHLEAETICTKTDFDFKMLAGSNIACRCVKTIPEILILIHAHGNFVFGVCKLGFSCNQRTYGHVNAHLISEPSISINHTKPD